MYVLNFSWQIVTLLFFYSYIFCLCYVLFSVMNEWLNLLQKEFSAFSDAFWWYYVAAELHLIAALRRNFEVHWKKWSAKIISLFLWYWYCFSYQYFCCIAFLFIFLQNKKIVNQEWTVLAVHLHWIVYVLDTGKEKRRKNCLYPADAETIFLFEET